MISTSVKVYSTVEHTLTLSSGGHGDAETASSSKHHLHPRDNKMTLQESSPPKPMTTTTTSTVEMAVCCGCRPQRRRYKKKHRKNLFQRRPRFLFFRRKKGYFDADMGQESEWQALERNIEYSQRDDDSQYFFDAVDTPLEDDEFPIDGYVIKSGGELGDYPIIFTTSLQHPAPHFTNDDPHTWLRKSLQVKTGGGAEEDEQQLAGAESLDEVHELHPKHKKSQQTQQKRRDSHLSVMSRDTIQSHKTPSQRFQKIKKRSTLEHKTQLEQPRVKSHGLQGYPGALTVDEMEECVCINLMLRWGAVVLRLLLTFHLFFCLAAKIHSRTCSTSIGSFGTSLQLSRRRRGTLYNMSMATSHKIRCR
jgi:hypothetical protein